jgi:hypothetical protein
VTVRIELTADVEAGLIAQAQAHGMDLPQYVETVLREQVNPSSPLSADERAAAWIQTAKRFPHTPPLSDDAVSRGNLYDTRG